MKNRVGEIEFTLLRSPRKTADIVVERDGSVVVRAPRSVSTAQIERAIDRRAGWVHRALAEWGELNGRRSRRALVPGSGIPYLGRNFRLKLIKDATEPLTLRSGRWELSEDLIAAHSEPRVRKAFRDFYITKGGPLLASRVDAFAKKVGVHTGKVSVRELGFHWASCGKAGALTFHWKLLMAPATAIDYVVVHELCHLRHRDHSKAFWNEVDKVLPRYRERKDWLRRHGASLDL
jgi:predicted metal-dependent hydrolase